MAQSTLRGFLRALLRDVRGSWKALALTDIAYRLLAFIVLTPIVTVAFHLFLAASGRHVVADEDILQFVQEPIGWLCILAIGTLSVAILALEQAALMGIVCAAEYDRHLTVRDALWFAAAHAWPVLRVTARILVLALLALAPLLAAAGIVYVLLLTKFDINYYLTEKPPAFWLAVGCGGVLGAVAAVVVLRLATSWFCALPLVCFENVAPHHALHVSRERVAGHRQKVVWWMLTWFLATLLLSTVATGIVVAIAQRWVPRATGSLGLLLFAVGTTLIVWTLVNLAIQLLNTTSFAVIFFRLYRELSPDQALDIERLAAEFREPSRRLPALTRKRLVALAVIGAGLALALGAVTLRRVRIEDRCDVIAHRGASGAAPENTMAAVRQAVAEQADWVEIDVQETADSEVVVFHDSDFKKLTGLDLKIWNATRADLEKIDIGSWFAPEFHGERVPTLAEVLAYCQGKIRVNIELKYYGHDQNLEQRVVDLVEAQGMQSDIVVMSLRQQGIDKLKSLRPAWKAGLLTAVASGKLTRVDADFLAVRADIGTRAFVRAAQFRNKNVLVWTVNDPISMSTMIGRGVDGIITDKPALAREVLSERARLSSAERMLLELATMLGVAPEIAAQ